MARTVMTSSSTLVAVPPFSRVEPVIASGYGRGQHTSPSTGLINAMTSCTTHIMNTAINPEGPRHNSTLCILTQQPSWPVSLLDSQKTVITRDSVLYTSEHTALSLPLPSPPHPTPPSSFPSISDLFHKPERIDPTTAGKGYTIQSDVWSFGITLVSLHLQTSIPTFAHTVIFPYFHTTCRSS